MKKWILAFSLCAAQTLYAQQWYSVDLGVHGKYEGLNAEISTMTIDSVHNILYVIGTFDSAGNLRSRNFTIWNGIRWITAETADSYFLPFSSGALIMYHDTLLYAGQFAGIGAFYDTVFLPAPIHANGIGGVSCFAYFHDTLWCGGSFGVEYYNGRKWIYPPGSFYPQHPYLEINAMVEYNNELIVGGYFFGVGDSVCYSIAAWDGKLWHPLGKGVQIDKCCLAPYVGTVTSLAVYKNELYVAGSFDSIGGIHSPGLARWYGSKWDSLNDTHFCGHPNTLVVADSNLYIGSDKSFFNGDCVTNRLARWDGTKIHDLNFKAGGTGAINSLTWFDGQLYVAGGFNSVNGDSSIQNIARTAIATVIKPAVLKDNLLQTYPNPAQDEVTVFFPFSNNIISIYDLFGRELKQLKVGPGNLKVMDLSFLQQGVYLVLIKNQQGNVIASEKLFKE